MLADAESAVNKKQVSFYRAGWSHKSSMQRTRIQHVSYQSGLVRAADAGRYIE